MKKLLSMILVVVLVLCSVCTAFAANLGNVTYSKDTSLKTKFNSFDSLTIKTGVTLTTGMSGSEPQGIEMHGPLVLEDGAKIIGKGIILMYRGSSYSGMKFYYKLANGEVRELPDMETAYYRYQNADDYVFTFSCDNQGRWVLQDEFVADPFVDDHPDNVHQKVYPDMRAESDWSYDALQYAIRYDLIDGINGKILPGEYATRAVLATAVNRVFGATEEADISNFVDVKESDPYYSEMQKAVKMKTFSGDGNMLHPEAILTRQEAFMVFAKVIKLPASNVDILNKFNDADQIADWAKPYIAAMVQAGYISGSGGNLNPTGLLTREELAKLIQNNFPNIVSGPGKYVRFDIGNVVVKYPDVVIANTTIKGDLIIGDGVGNSSVTIDNVVVEGRLVVRGGENQLKIINNSVIPEMAYPLK